MPKPKQEQLKYEIELEKYILLGLHRKRDTAILTEADKSGLKSREDNLKKLAKKMKDTEENRRRQQEFRNNRKRKMNSLDDETRKKITGKSICKLGQPPKYDEEELVAAIARVAMSGSGHPRKKKKWNYSYD